MDEEVRHIWVNCKEEGEEESNLREETESSTTETCSGELVSLAKNNEVATTAELSTEMLEMEKKKKKEKGRVVENENKIEDGLVAEDAENVGATSKYQRTSSVENNDIEFCDVVEMSPVPARVEIRRTNTEKGKMYGGLENGSEDEEKGNRPSIDGAMDLQVISTDVVINRPASLDEEIEQQGEEDVDIVTPILSLLLFNIIMPCLDIYFDTLLIQKLSPDHLGCLLVILSALTINFAFTCLAWWRFEPDDQKTWSWIFLLLQIWPQLKAGQVRSHEIVFFNRLKKSNF